MICNFHSSLSNFESLRRKLGIKRVMRSCDADAYIYHMEDGRDVHISGCEILLTGKSNVIDYMVERLTEPRLVDYIEQMKAGRARRKAQKK